MKAATDLIHQAQSILISGHLRADGDCLGTEVVLFHAFRALGKEVRIVNPDEPDRRVHFLMDQTPVEFWGGPGTLPKHDLFVICDCSTLSRLGGMEADVRAAKSDRLVVDHHLMAAEDESLWTARVHDVTAAASGILSVELCQALGVDLTLPLAEAAFVAIATDTGWFRYSNVDDRAWACALKLLRAGVIPDSLYRKIYQQADPGHPKGMSAGLANVVEFSEGRGMLASLSQNALSASGGTLEDGDDVLDLLRSVKGVDAVAFVYERKDGIIKASMRSKEFADVASAANKLGGGGHVRAAGVTFIEGVTLDDAVSQVLDVLEQELAKLSS